MIKTWLKTHIPLFMDKQTKWRRSINSFFTPKNFIEGSEETHISPSGKYKLKITKYKTAKGCWEYSRGQVYTQNDELIADVKQNYHHFPFGWAEGHKNGHDYLLCCENYQGQTVIELDTGKRVDYLPDAAMRGFGFCWVDRVPSADRSMLAVSGCYWACPYEIIIFDFSNPMEMPYKEVARGEDVNGDMYPRSWTDNNKLILEKERTVHKPTNQYLDEIPDSDDSLEKCACYDDVKIELEHMADEKWIAEVDVDNLKSGQYVWRKKGV